jgi:UDP-N-acetyl-D-galactosamine dehydrogenase
MNNKNIKLSIIGLGYVGLPLAVEFGKKRPVICYDLNKKRIDELKKAKDKNNEVTKTDLLNNKNLKFTSNYEDLKDSNCYIISVPTPINNIKEPDLKPLLSASKIVAKVLKNGDTVIYESTVYPGCTEEKCVPILQDFSGLKFNKDFFCGYSPERINPGDKKHRINTITKVTSGSTTETLELVDNLYNEIIDAGTHKVPSIKIAEAAKVIENTQRDLNIALINELSMIFNMMNIDTEEVLRAAGTKWNFLPFRPGLVGGHCIGVDPYYLTYKCKQIGFHPNIILAGRNTNDCMPKYIVTQLLKEMKKKSIKPKVSNVLIMGATFKENCPDLRNSGVEKLFKDLQKKGCEVEIYDPIANDDELKKFYGSYRQKKLKKNFYDAVILAVAHDEIKKINLNYINKLCKSNFIIYDLKNILKKSDINLRL